jgi:nucleotide-binding universal stress UspA family protein
MIKDIVVHLASVPGSGADRYAVSVAEAFGAHVTGIAFAFEPVITGTVMSDFAANLIDAQRSENEKAAKEAIARYEQAARASGVSVDTRIITAALPNAAEIFGQIARRFDISIVGQPEPHQLARAELIVAAAIFNSGRPVILVPFIHKGSLGLNRVMVCWDGSRTAARAVGDAMPLLERAKAVDVVIIATEQAKSDEVPSADIGRHLARHGIKVDVQRVQAPGIDVASAIPSYAADNAIDLVVMGGYGHSRLREFILGGATRGMLEAMTVPTLMSH